MASKAKIDPWGSLDIEDYRKLFDEFGIESFAKYKHALREPVC